MAAMERQYCHFKSNDLPLIEHMGKLPVMLINVFQVINKSVAVRISSIKSIRILICISSLYVSN